MDSKSAMEREPVKTLGTAYKTEFVRGLSSMLVGGLFCAVLFWLPLGINHYVLFVPGFLGFMCIGRLLRGHWFWQRRTLDDH